MITLTIIGVIAALTIPNLIQNYKKHERATQVKTAYSIIQNAIRMSIAENGNPNDWDYSGNLDFAEKYILPYLKIQKKCGLGPGVEGFIQKGCFATDLNTWYYLNGKTSIQEARGGYDSRWCYKVVLQNGMHLATWASSKNNRPPNFGPNFHVNYPKFIFDVNGGSGKTIAGIDVFEFYLNPQSEEVKATSPDGSNILYACENYGLGCTSKIQNNSWEIPNDYPVKKW